MKSKAKILVLYSILRILKMWCTMTSMATQSMLSTSWIILAWMVGVECVTMALDASIGERPYVDESIVKNIRKIGLG